jgi:hypothetical protein
MGRLMRDTKGSALAKWREILTAVCDISGDSSGMRLEAASTMCDYISEVWTQVR